MATATVVAAWQDATYAHIAATVNEGGSIGLVEYIAKTPLLDSQGAAKSSSQTQTDLTAALCAIRDAQTAAATPLNLSGTLTI
jgi:hypothetical protein